MNTNDGIISTSQLMLQYLHALDELREHAPAVGGAESYGRADSKGGPLAPVTEFGLP